LSENKTIVYLGLGSNLGKRVENVQKAIKLIQQKVTVVNVSSLYDTQPVGYVTQPNFINAACEVNTSFTPQELLSTVKKIEKDMGRIPNFINGPRIIDIDILLYNDSIIISPELTIPHPHLMERAFVLIPLAEIAPEMKHPVNKKTIQELLHELGAIDGVKQLKNKDSGE